MGNDKKNDEDSNIDEQYLMSIMAGSIKKELPNQESELSIEKPITKQKVKSKKKR